MKAKRISNCFPSVSLSISSSYVHAAELNYAEAKLVTVYSADDTMLNKSLKSVLATPFS